MNDETEDDVEDSLEDEQEGSLDDDDLESFWSKKDKYKNKYYKWKYSVKSTPSSCTVCRKVVHGIMKRSPIPTPSAVKNAIKLYCATNIKKTVPYTSIFCKNNVSKSDRLVTLIVKYQKASKVCKKMALC